MLSYALLSGYFHGYFGRLDDLIPALALVGEFFLRVMTFDILLVCFLASLTVNVTVYFPAFLYVCFAFLVVTIFVLSPKFQDHFVGDPVLLSRNVTVIGVFALTINVKLALRFSAGLVADVAASAVADNKIRLCCKNFFLAL